MNRDEIRNPHWIYPGQIIYFDRAARPPDAEQAGRAATPTPACRR